MAGNEHENETTTDARKHSVYSISHNLSIINTLKYLFFLIAKRFHYQSHWKSTHHQIGRFCVTV